MSEQISTREAILGAATALEGQWSPAWIAALRQAVEPPENEHSGAGLDREEYLKRFPAMTDALGQFEERWGAFCRAGSINFNDGRFVMVTRFERIYSIAFHNPGNVGDEKTLETNLSPEAVRALTILASFYARPGDDDAFTAALGLVEGKE